MVGPAELRARTLRTKHLERAHRNINKIEVNTEGGSIYAAVLAAAADAYMAGYYASPREGTNPFIDIEEPS